MSFTDEQEYQKHLDKKAEESRGNTFDSWLVDLEDKEQPEACSIDNPDCENCGS
tara:strand:- start:744 stop:905 length:162 start_codon:yes stop_codon:yes gene_type:complete